MQIPNGAYDKPKTQSVRQLNLDRVLVPLDGSEISEYILPFASMLTRWLNGELTLFHALLPMHPAFSRQKTVAYPDTQHDRGSHLAESYLEEIAARLNNTKVKTRSSVATGDVAKIISSRAVIGRFGLTAVTVGTQSRVRRLIRSSLLDLLWKSSPVPLMLVNPGDSVNKVNLPTEPREFIVPMDATPTCMAALPIASILANSIDAQVTLLATSKTAIDPITATQDKNSVSKAVAYLEEHKTTNSVETTSKKGVSERQKQSSGSWVIAGSRMRFGIRRSLFGSSGDQFLRECKEPLIVVPEPGVAELRFRNARSKSLSATDQII